MSEYLIFVASLLLPFLFFRTVLTKLVKKKGLPGPYIRQGRKFHHLHFGMGILIIGIFGFLSLKNSLFGVIVSGIGLGMMFDDFVPSLYIPESEPETSKMYFGSFRPTLYLLLSISTLILVLGFLIQKFK
jgi:hypothetical protein